LRTYGGIFDQEVPVRLEIIANKTEMTVDEISDVLIQLEKDKMISLKLYQTDAEITFLQPREDDKTINRISDIIIQQNDLKTNQINDILNYVKNTEICRSKQVLDYFGESDTKECGICSTCLSYNNDELKIEEAVSKITTLLKERPYSSREISNKLAITEANVTKALKILMENRVILVTKTNSYQLKHK
jgi:ATP-dependent DNA helicase RecQ